MSTRAMGYRDEHQGKGADYADAFASIPHRALLWKLERRVLDRIWHERFASTRPAYLDFACGTGRILGYLAPRARIAVGVDVSSTMLAIARDTVPHASLIEADVTRSDALGSARFDLITAFRFFPNAEATLRTEVMEKLAAHLAPGGCLVFNNHMNETSLARRIARLRNGSVGDEGMMRASEVHDLVRGVGLHVVEAHPLGVLPFTERRLPRPYWLCGQLESFVSRLPGVLPLAQDVIYVCRESSPGGKAH